jgi:uncharacterized protein (DUF58 family)
MPIVLRKPAEAARSDPGGVSVQIPELLRLRGEARRLDLVPRGKVLATRSGGHLSRFRGRGMEFDESRGYQPGDDVRNMDWRVTARTGTAHVKLFREERERPLWLLVDLGPRMRFGTRVAFKSVVAARAAALLAWAAADRGDRVGGLVFDEHRHHELRPAARTRGVLPLLQALAAPSVTGAAGGFPDVSEAATRLVGVVRPGSLVFLLSDFAGVREADSAWLSQLATGNEVVLTLVRDPLEGHPPPPNRYAVRDGARGGILDTTEALSRERYRRHFADHHAMLARLARRHRVHDITLSTAEATGAALARGLTPSRVRRSQRQ